MSEPYSNEGLVPDDDRLAEIDPGDIDPGDMELMCWLDGELDPEQEEDFLARLETDDVLQAKLAGLQLAGDLLRDHVDEDSQADGIAAAVMAELVNRGKLQLDGEAAPLAPVNVGRSSTPAATPPANDNARTIFGLAAGAAAVAAGLFLWGGTDIEDDATARRHRFRRPPVAIAAAAPVAPSAAAPTPAAKVAKDGPSAEVASVDFGSHSGAVFYTAGDASAVVVWITDSGEE